MFARLFAAGKIKKQAYGLYTKLVTQARNPVFYTDLGVADTLDGRFDMILLHVFIVQHRLEKDGEASVKLRRIVQEAMISDMDRSLREMGVGDMSVGKEMKKMGAAWFGRMKAYAAALSDGAPESELAQTLTRNLYRSREEQLPVAEKLGEYVRDCLTALDGVESIDIEQSNFDLPAPSKL